MSTAGYSGTPLINKLGIQPGMRLRLVNAPENYPDLLGKSVETQLVSGKEIPDLVHFFARDFKTYLSGMKKILPICKKNTSLVVWVSWYKKTAGMATDLTENIIRDFALENGLVDIKVCAVSDVWSGLKLVVPLAKR